MTTIKEAFAREARVKALVKKIKRVDTSKIVLPERKDVTVINMKISTD